MIINKTNSMLLDIIFTLKSWRVIYLRASQAIRSRYVRSQLGQFWSVISIALLIISTGLVWSFIWGVDADKYLPYVACGHVIYLFISGTINESTVAIIGEKRLFYKYNTSPILAIHILVLRNLIVFFHNLPILILVIAWSSDVAFSFGLNSLVYFSLVIVFIYTSSIFISIICVYYRDLIQLIGSILQISFLVTPVIWSVDRIPEEFRKYVYLNPFAGAIEVIRNPILGSTVSVWAIISLILWITICFSLSVLVWKYKRKHLIYWI